MPTTKESKTRDTKLRHIFEVNMIKAHPLVNTVLENVLLQNLRQNDAGSHYVDVYRVTSLLHHLLQSLNLANSSYTLFLLNPKNAVSEGPNAPKYGYRTGLAKSEIEALRADREWMRKLEILLSTKRHSKESPSHGPEKLPHKVCDALKKRF